MIILELKKDFIISKTSGEKIDCVNVNIYDEENKDETIDYLDFKIKIPFDKKDFIKVEDIKKDTFNRYVLNEYSVPNAYSYGLKLLIDRIKEKKGE